MRTPDGQPVRIELPMSLLSEAGIAPETPLIAFSDG
jgi:hypothetical protein